VSQSRAGAEHAWDRGVAGWEIYYGLVLAATLLLIEVSGPLSLRQRLLASAALLAMGAWYVGYGRRAMYCDTTDSAVRGTVYLLGLVILLVAADLQTLACSYALFALCPQCFMAVPFRRAVVAVCVINATAVVRLFLGPVTGEARTQVLAFAVAGAAFSVAFGGWVQKIVAQSRDRATLIEQLETTRAELAGANHAAGILAERHRLAGEIHDTIAQGFTSIVMLIQAAESAIERDPAVARGHLALAAETARENLAETRALVAGLAPAQLDGGTLDDALGRLAGQASGRLGIDADFEVAGCPRPLATGAEVMLLRVCQEALSNVRKHAQAQRASVRLSYGPGAVRLEVSDDGAGFDQARVNGGYGLRGMRARVAEAGGSFTVRTGPGAGTTVSVEVPA
jgi:signal transduction histidine kinase